MVFASCVSTKKDLSTKGKEVSGMNKLNSQKIENIILKIIRHGYFDGLEGVSLQEPDPNCVSFMKEKKSELLDLVKCQHDKLSLSKTKHFPLSKSKGVKREKKKGVGSGEETETFEPTGQDLASPLFNSIWNTIKGWDIQREEGQGYAHATGTDVMRIIKAVKGESKR